MMAEVFVTRRSKRQELLNNIRKTPLYHRMVIDLVEMAVQDARTAYEDTAPASEYLRGRLGALKDLHKELTTQ